MIAEVESAHENTATSISSKGIIAGITTNVQRIEYLLLKEPVTPRGIVVAVASITGNTLNAIVVIVGVVSDVLDHSRLCRAHVTGIRVGGNKVFIVLELHKGFSVLDSVVYTTVTNNYTTEIDRRLGVSTVIVQHSVRPGRNVVTTVALAGNDELASSKFWEEFQPLKVENDKVFCCLNRRCGLLTVTKTVADVLGLIQIKHISMGVPCVWVGGELGVVITLRALATLLHVEEY